MNPTLEDFVMALRYLYYVKSESVITDYQYDGIEKLALKLLSEDSELNLAGSDSEKSYTKIQKEIAERLLKS